MRLQILILTFVAFANACMSGSSSPRRSTRGRYFHALALNQYEPNRSELSLSASGPAVGPTRRDSPLFSKLVENHNSDIIFKDEEGTGADRLMSQRCKDRLDGLAILVMNQWAGVKVRVIEGWDEDGTHAADSLHYEGRAVDVTTSDRDKSKLGLLARLALEAGFDWVYYESKSHIHCSVKSDESDFTASTGCFSGDSFVNLVNGSTLPIQDLRIGDSIKAVCPSTGEIISDKVIAFLDRNAAEETIFIKIATETTTITMTPLHLLFVLRTGKDNSITGTALAESTLYYAKDIIEGDSLYIYKNETLVSERVKRTEIVRSSGFYAPLTYSGTLLVNGAAASCYSHINSQSLAHLAMVPLRVISRFLHVVSFKTESLPSSGVHWYAQVLLNVIRSTTSSLLF